MSNSRVAIVMPSYNTSKYISMAIQSIIEQDYRNFKLFIVDDGSIDNTLEIANEWYRKFPDYIHVISKDNGGVGSALNAGFNEVNREGNYQYGTMVSSDNLYFKNFLSSLVKIMDMRDENTAMVYADFVYIDEFNRQIGSVIHQPKNKYDLINGYDCGIAFLFRMSAKNRAGEYWNKICEDYEMAVRIMQYGDMEMVPIVLACHRIRSNQLTNSSPMEEQKAAEYSRRLAKKLFRNEDSKVEEVYE